jgi:hypothetical protein
VGDPDAVRDLKGTKFGEQETRKAQAATAQLLVLFGIMAAQTVTAGLAERLICARRLLPRDLHAALID